MRSPPTPSNPDYYEVFVQGMRELGYIEGQNLHIEWRGAEGHEGRLPKLAEELVALNPEVIVTHATQGTLAVQRATRTIPIVTAAVTDPVGSGFATSLAKPGGNITGLSLIVGDISPKHVELLKTVLPGLSLIAVLVNPDNPSHPSVLKSIQVAAQQASTKVLAVDSRGDEEDIEHAFVTIAKQRAQAVIIASDSFFVGQRRRIIEAAAKDRIPSMFAFRQDVEGGGLMSYGQNVLEFFRRAASYVDKILRGAKPGDLPIEQPTKFELVINLKTAKALGLTIPQTLLLRADELIE